MIGHLEEVGRLQGLIRGWGECPWKRSTPNPILLINHTYDPNSGYPNAVHAEQYLGNAVILTQDGSGHLESQDPSKCVEKAMVDYQLVDLITLHRGTRCPSDHKPFDPDFQSGTESPSPGQVVEQALP